jgi:predicted  nucleic acid-binding Zn-ribbon protein
MAYPKEKNAAAQARWRERRNGLAKRAEELEAEVTRLKAQVAVLKADLRAAKARQG